MKRIIRLTESDLTRIVERVLNEGNQNLKTPIDLLDDAKSKLIQSKYLVNMGDGTFVIWGAEKWGVSLIVDEGTKIVRGEKKGTVTIDVETDDLADYNYIKTKFNNAVSNDTYNPSKDSRKYRIATKRTFTYEPNPTVGINTSNTTTNAITELFKSLLNEALSTLINV